MSLTRSKLLMASISHQDLEKEYWTPERCFILESSNTSTDPDASIARARVEPGVTTSWHRLKGIVERYYILEGEGVVEVGDLPPEEVHPGSVVIIPESCRQRIQNTGSADLIFLAICTPRFEPGAYEDLEYET
jgi:mannose-6-phosphate isomerase-like protein (cupin superfamily)